MRGKIFRLVLLAIVGGLMELPASRSATLQFDLPGSLDRQSVGYACGTATFSAEYYNLPGTSLVVVPVEGGPRVFVSVTAASGAKYVSGSHVWWTRGNRADLYDETEPEASPMLCKVVR